MGRPLEGPPGIAVVGCGLIGKRRAQFASPGKVLYCVDTDLARAKAAAPAGAVATTNFKEALADPKVQLVVVATTNEALAQLGEEAAAAGCHVLLEKPAARTVEELDRIAAAAAKTGVQVRVGFNHRYHRGLRKLHALISEGAVGDLLFVRARYGHGGRVGYEKEWRSDPVRSGGGELIDQGVHLIDLSRWFLGEFTRVQGRAHTYFWNMVVDDNAFLHLETARGQTAWLHVSCSEWKNTFSLEVYGRTGKLQIDGLGGSYGVEKLTWYRMLPEMGPPETTSWEYPMADDSWQVEFAEFLEDVRLHRTPAAGLAEARAALVVVEQIYRESGYPRTTST